MTFPEKIKNIRHRMNLSQESLADTLGISRQSVAKWESGDGLPDTFNMKELAKLTGLSVDYLLDSINDLPLLTLSEKIDKSALPTRKGYTKNDEAVLSRYAGCTIYPLTRRKKMKPIEQLIDFFVSPGALEVADQLANFSTYYLVENKSVSLIVNIKNNTMITKEISHQAFSNSRIDFEGNIYQIATKSL